MENEKQEEKGIVKYESRDGQQIKLSFQTISKYLVQGNGKCSEQELMYFLGVCKSRALNPFKKDAYLIKFGSDPAAIVTSIDYFRSRARAQPDCKGWKKGVIVQLEDGTVEDSAGLVLEGERLVGGFFEAQPEGWAHPFRLEVNLNGFIKKTKDGRITRFWEESKQPIMIAKVAESQGLRTLWPDEFQGMYEKDEIQPSEASIIDAEIVRNADDLTSKIQENVTGEEIKDNKDPDHGVWNKDIWWAMRSGTPEKGTGFAAYLKTHEQAYHNLHDGLKSEIKAKYERTYPGDQFPIKPFGNENEGEDKGIGEKDDPIANGIEIDNDKLKAEAEEAAKRNVENLEKIRGFDWEVKQEAFKRVEKDSGIELGTDPRLALWGPDKFELIDQIRDMCEVVQQELAM